MIELLKVLQGLCGMLWTGEKAKGRVKLRWRSGRTGVAHTWSSSARRSYTSHFLATMVRVRQLSSTRHTLSAHTAKTMGELASKYSVWAELSEFESCSQATCSDQHQPQKRSF